MSESCRELCRDLTTPSHQGSTMLYEVPRCQRQPDACWEECQEYSGLSHTGFDVHQTQSENKSKGTLLFFFHAASKLPISHTGCLLETAPENVFWLIQFFSKVAENSLLTLLSFVVLCLTLLVLYHELVGLLCTAAKPGCIQSCSTGHDSWPAQWLWMKLHEIEAQKLEKRFEEI